MKKIVSCVMLMMMMCVATVSAQWSVTPEAGMNVTKYKGSPSAIGFKAGAAVSYTFGSGLFSLQSGLYYVQRGTGKSFYGTAYGKGVDQDGKEQDRYISFSPGGLWYGGTGVLGGYYGNGSFFPTDMRVDGITLTEGSTRRDYLQLPILGRFNWEVGKDVKLHIAAGPYLAYGISGKSKSKTMEMSEKGYSTTYDSWEPFGKYSSHRRFDWGLMFNAGIEVKRFTLNASYDLGLGKEYESQDIDLKYQTVSFTVGYRF
ncbi:porin family protein [Parabacteroides gordonii]|uniref:porin family protein n=1 Tax=Parabacteroides gordonii TaxID=574930 RepID=UPI0026E9751A|nr:porin family protein [Parabacteroides gordonii]